MALTARADADVIIDLRDPPAAPKPRRVVAIDAVRGLAIVVMLLAVHPGPRDGLWVQLKHPEWAGLHLCDLFFPLFLFAIGASMPLSDTASTWRKVLRRASILFALGLVLQMIRHGEVLPQGVLQHIAIAYLLGWLVLKAPVRAQVAICVATLVAAWVAHVVFAVGGDPWQQGGGFAHMVNGWFFGDFRTEGVPQSAVSTVNVVVGAWVTRLVLRGGDVRTLLRRLTTWTVGLVALGLLLATVIPLNKHLWTPSFAVLSAGTSIGFFALLYWVADVRRHRRGVQPLVHLGTNAILIYGLFIGVGGALTRYRGGIDRLYEGVSPTLVANGWGVAWLLLGWALAWALYRRRLFLKI